MTNIKTIIKKKDITEKECEMVCSAFSQPFNEMHDLIEGNEELEKKYSFLLALYGDGLPSSRVTLDL